MVWWIHALHVLAVTIIVGGSLAHALGTVTDPRRFEWWFWGAAGVVVATGVGNVATEGTRFDLQEVWGILLLVKLLLVLALLGLSVRRSMLAWHDEVSPAWYHASAGIGATIALLGVMLAHASF